MDINGIERQTAAAAAEFMATAAVEPGQLLVVGCSTSEIAGERIGTAGSGELATAVLSALLAEAGKTGVYLAIQCCEHLNRTLVVERGALEKYALTEVCAVPFDGAGGALASAAYRRFDAPALAESVAAHAGLDIGFTLIGMHLRPVAVPVRLANNKVGEATVLAAHTRPRLIGGERARYAL